MKTKHSVRPGQRWAAKGKNAGRVVQVESISRDIQLVNGRWTSKAVAVCVVLTKLDGSPMGCRRTIHIPLSHMRATSKGWELLEDVT